MVVLELLIVVVLLLVMMVVLLLLLVLLMVLVLLLLMVLVLLLLLLVVFSPGTQFWGNVTVIPSRTLNLHSDDACNLTVSVYLKYIKKNIDFNFSTC